MLPLNDTKEYTSYDKYEGTLELVTTYFVKATFRATTNLENNFISLLLSKNLKFHLPIFTARYSMTSTPPKPSYHLPRG